MILPIEKILSGGQTGVDQGALDFAIQYNIAHGGICPKNRLSENGIIPSKYNLTESDSDSYKDRTLQNVLKSDGTLIIKDSSKLGKGSSQTIELCSQYNKPLMVLTINDESEIKKFVLWLRDNQINVLNIAGNRESQSPGIQKKTTVFLAIVFGFK